MSRYLIRSISFYGCLFVRNASVFKNTLQTLMNKKVMVFLSFISNSIHGIQKFLSFCSHGNTPYTFGHVSFIELYTSNRNSMSVSWFAVEEPDMLRISWWHVKTKDKSMHISKKARLFLMKLFYSSYSIQAIPMITMIDLQTTKKVSIPSSIQFLIYA